MYKVVKHITCLLLLVFSFFHSRAAVIASAETVAQIVIPADANAVEKYAAKELSEHLKAVCGKDIPIAAKADASVTQIRLGRASGVKSSRLPVNAALVIIADDFIDIAGQDGDGDPLDFRVSAGTLFGVYEFLERELDIRWLWPGKSGTLIPKRAKIDLPESEYLVDPPMAFISWQNGAEQRHLWFNKLNADKFIRERTVWLRRHRFNRILELDGQKILMDYAVRFPGRSKLFQMLPDGKISGGSWCLSSPELVETVIDDWQRTGEKVLNLSAANLQSKCVCANCLKSDKNRNASRLEAAKKKFASGDHLWYEELGSTGDRNTAFLNSLFKAASGIDPECRVMAAINENFASPPVRTRLNRQVILLFPRLAGHPWQRERIADFKKDWAKWAKTRAGMMLVIDNGQAGHFFPLMCHRQFAECYDFARNNGLAFAEFVSGGEGFGVNGLFHYTVAAKAYSGMFKNVAELERDYLSAFGKAENVMRQFIELMSSVSSGEEPVNLAVDAGVIFTDDVMQRGDILLDEAGKLTADSPDIFERVKFVRTGFEDVKLVLALQKSAMRCQQGESPSEFLGILAELREFRRKNEALGYADIGRMNAVENRVFPVHLMSQEQEKTLDFLPEKCDDSGNWITESNLQLLSHNPEQPVMLSASGVSGEYIFRVNNRAVSGIFDTEKRLFAADIGGLLHTGNNPVQIIRKSGDPPPETLSVKILGSAAEKIPEASWQLQVDSGDIRSIGNAYPLIIDAGDQAETSGRFFCNIPMVPGGIYEVKVRFRLAGQGNFSVGLRSARENIGKHNILLKSFPGGNDDEVREVSGRIVAGSENCAIYLNWQGSGRVEVISAGVQLVTALGITL